MLVYITNRKLTYVPKDRPVRNSVHKDEQKSEIGIDLNRRKTPFGDSIYCGISTNKTHTNYRFFPRGEEQKLFDAIDEAEFRKPWVLLLHGFHQDPVETIRKAEFLIEHQNVNVVLFSWPSRPKPIDAFDVSVLDDYIKDYVKSVVFGFGAPGLAAVFVGEMRKWLQDLVTNYVPARKNAEASTTDFFNAVQVLSDHLLPRLKDNRLSLLVHSMGNYLLQNVMLDKGNLPCMFTNIMLHQADVNASDHAAWVPKLAPCAGSKLYITVNVFDYVLAASNILNRYKLGRKQVERLGQSVRIRPDGAYQGYINGFVEYLDFTDSFGVEVKHEIFTNSGASTDSGFLAGADEVDEVIFEVIGKVLRSEKRDGLRTSPGKQLKGMSMMPAVPHIHKPRWIVEDPALCDEHEDICFIDSYEDFRTRYRQRPSDPDLED